MTSKDIYNHKFFIDFALVSYNINMMNISKNEAEKHAQDERDKAKRLQGEADKKDQEIKKLHEEVEKDQKKAKVMGLGGMAGSMLGSSAKKHAQNLQKQIKQIENDASFIREKAKFAEKEAHKWDEKAKFANE